MSDHELTVIQDFGKYKKGQRISDHGEITGILAGELRVHVRKVWPSRRSMAAKINTAVVEKAAEPEKPAVPPPAAAPSPEPQTSAGETSEAVK